MSLCESCKLAEFHGYPPKDAPEWEVGTVYFWCGWVGTHGQRTDCDGFVQGKPKRYDKRGREL